MTEKEKELLNIFNQARESGHIFPGHAVAEAVLESGWFKSKLFIMGKNLFGVKQSKSNPRFETLSFPTKEFLNGQWMTINADFISYPTIKDSFEDRMNLLKRLSPTYLDYKKALESTNGEEFIINVSKTWATDPKRADKVLQIYNDYKYLFEETSNKSKLGEFWTKFKNSLNIK